MVSPGGADRVPAGRDSLGREGGFECKTRVKKNTAVLLPLHPNIKTQIKDANHQTEGERVKEGAREREGGKTLQTLSDVVAEFTWLKYSWPHVSSQL